MGKGDVFCVWSEEYYGDYGCYWTTECGNSFEFTDGGKPSGNEFGYCPYCGKPIAELELADAVGSKD